MVWLKPAGSEKLTHDGNLEFEHGHHGLWALCFRAFCRIAQVEPGGAPIIMPILVRVLGCSAGKLERLATAVALGIQCFGRHRCCTGAARVLHWCFLVRWNKILCSGLEVMACASCALLQQCQRKMGGFL